MIEKVYIFNAEADGFEKGWVYVQIPGCLEETLAVEVIEYMGYSENPWNPLLGKSAALKENLVTMPMETFKEWEAVYGEDYEAMNKIVNDVLEAHRVSEALK